VFFDKFLLAWRMWIWSLAKFH